MSKLILKHSLEKFFGKNHPKIEFAMAEIDAIYNHPLNKIVIEDTGKKYKPAYQDASEENLDDGRCRFCGMTWYSCLCSHED